MRADRDENPVKAEPWESWELGGYSVEWSVKTYKLKVLKL